MKALGEYDFEVIDSLSVAQQEWILMNVELDDAEWEKKMLAHLRQPSR